MYTGNNISLHAICKPGIVPAGTYSHSIQNKTPSTLHRSLSRSCKAAAERGENQLKRAIIDNIKPQPGGCGVKLLIFYSRAALCLEELQSTKLKTSRALSGIRLFRIVLLKRASASGTRQGASWLARIGISTAINVCSEDPGHEQRG